MRIGDYNVTLRDGIKRVTNSSEQPLPPETEKEKFIETPSTMKSIPNGRVSVANDANSLITMLKDSTTMVDVEFNREYIPLIRKLYKVNSDVSIALQDTFKLANTGHSFIFPYNEDVESTKMEEHIRNVQKRWTNYTAGIDGLVNKMITQALVGGAISIEAVPNNKLNGISTILFVKPEEIYFKRETDGVYQPYQINKTSAKSISVPYIKLNTTTYKYIGIFSDVDEPNGVPPFMASLEALATQRDMKRNFQEIMALVGLLGFLEVKTEKPQKRATESEPTYTSRLNNYLTEVKANVKAGMKDGVVVGYMDDHEFKMNSTTKDVGNIDKLWSLNQQSVANGLSTTGALIGVNSSTSEGGTGILLSKLISQLKNLQTLAAFVLEFLYELELRMAGFKCKGVKVTFNSTTISDEVKIQQGMEYKIRNLIALYRQGIISQNQVATAMGYLKPHLPEPLEIEEPGDSGDSKDKEDRKDGKIKSERGVRDKSKTNPKRADQDSRPRG